MGFYNKNGTSYVFIHITSTGVDPLKDKIVAITAVSQGERRQWIFNPKVSISPEVAERIQITDADVRALHKFHYYAQDIYDFIVGRDLICFGSHFTDLLILAESFAESGIAWLEFQRPIYIGELHKNSEPEILAAVIKAYGGSSHEQQGDALVNALTARRILMQLEKIASIDSSRGEVLALDPFGILIIDSEGRTCFGNHAYRGVPILERRAYAERMLNEDIPKSTKFALKDALG